MTKPKRAPCPTCPWRKSTPPRGFPGGLVMAERLVEMVTGGPEKRVMQCHCTPDDRPKVCVGYGLQVGFQSVAYRLAVAIGAVDHDSLGTDETLHSLESLLEAHGGKPDVVG